MKDERTVKSGLTEQIQSLKEASPRPSVATSTTVKEVLQHSGSNVQRLVNASLPNNARLSAQKSFYRRNDLDSLKVWTKRSKRYTWRMTSHYHARLEELAKILGMSKAKVLATAIDGLYERHVLPMRR